MNTESPREWIGREQTLEDEITAAPGRALSATLESQAAPIATGSHVPPLWHWLYFLAPRPASEVDVDGHPRRGGFLPPVQLPRRMWAGGRLEWNGDNPLTVGEAARRISRIKSISEKQGRSGPLVFVTVLHEVHNQAGLCVSEEQDIVYKDAPQSGDPEPVPVTVAPGAWRRELVPDEVMLFRYSALTFNSHRIHYDRPYATSVEAYPGLVVHGPLIATLLLDALYRQAPRSRVRTFEFKAVRPSFDSRPLLLNGTPEGDGQTVKLWASDNDGYLAMRAEARLQ